MNEKVIKFTELCFLSRTSGLTEEKHLEKIELAKELVTDGLMTHDKMYNFINEEDSKYFTDTINRAKKN